MSNEGGSDLGTTLIILIVVGGLLGIAIIGGSLYTNSKQKQSKLKQETNIANTNSLDKLNTVDMDPNAASDDAPKLYLTGTTPGATPASGDSGAKAAETNSQVNSMSSNQTDAENNVDVQVQKGNFNKTVSTLSVGDDESVEKLYGSDEYETQGKQENDITSGNNDDKIVLTKAWGISGTKTGGTPQTKVGERSTQQLEGVEGSMDYESWSVQQVNQWLIEKLKNSKMSNDLIDPFMNQWKTQHINGVVLKLYKDDTQSLQDVKQQIQSSGNVEAIHAIWAVVKNEIRLL